MQTSAFEYKCRRCGERYTEPFGRLSGPLSPHNGSVYANASWTNENGSRVFTMQPAQETNVHDCPEGGQGISDLIGITPPRGDKR